MSAARKTLKKKKNEYDTSHYSFPFSREGNGVSEESRAIIVLPISSIAGQRGSHKLGFFSRVYVRVRVCASVYVRMYGKLVERGYCRASIMSRKNEHSRSREYFSGLVHVRDDVEEVREDVRV